MQEGLVFVTGGSGDLANAIVKKFPRCISPDRSEMDVTYEPSIHHYIERYKPEILVNCAGYISPQKVINSDVDIWKKEIEVNLIGVYLCTKIALENGAKKIINIASSSGLRGRSGWSGYCASKAGVISFTQSLVEEGIDAYCVSPHRIKTKMRKALFPEEDDGSLLDPDTVAEEIRKIVDGVYKTGSHIDVSLSKVTLL